MQGVVPRSFLLARIHGRNVGKLGQIVNLSGHDWGDPTRRVIHGGFVNSASRSVSAILNFCGERESTFGRFAVC